MAYTPSQLFGFLNGIDANSAPNSATLTPAAQAQVTSAWGGYTAPPSTGAVQGTSTQNNTNNNTNTNTGGGGGITTDAQAIAAGYTGLNNYRDNQASQQSSTPNYDSLISQINSLADQSMSALDPQRDAQNTIANNNYTQGVSDLNTQATQGTNDLNLQNDKVDSNQVKTLNDLTNNLRNMFSSGQTYLGARGAGDSSAANQYSYALTQMGNKNRGDVMAQTADLHSTINGKIADLQSQVQQGIQSLLTSKNNALQGIASWYASAQDQIRQTKGQNIVALGQQALNNAMNAINQVNQNYQNQQNSLMSWAENNATTIQGLKSNLAQVANYTPNMPTAGTITGLGGATGTSSSGGYYAGNNTSNQNTDIYGNPIQ